MAVTVRGLKLSLEFSKVTFLCDLFQVLPDLLFGNYGDDNTPNSTNKVLQNLEKKSRNLFKWLTKNLPNVNP